MYIPKHFQMDNQEEVFDVIETYSFATLVSQHKGSPFATHLPLVLDRETGTLHGHVARPNDQWKEIEGQEVLVMFQGPHSYISPSWYESNKAVPTWNYVAVHAYGKAEIVEDEQELLDSLGEMVNMYESPDSSYRVNEVDPDYIKGLSQGIVGLKIKITRIEGKKKLSQNHSKERRQLVIDQLKQIKSEGAEQIAHLMVRNFDK